MIHAASHVYKEEQTLPNSLSRKEDHTVLLRLICVSTEPAHRPLKAFHGVKTYGWIKESQQAWQVGLLETPE
jgi:hypothetical protein